MTTMKKRKNRLTTTIKRQWFAEIVDGSKTIEYRDMKPYWRDKLKTVRVPFELRLINGYSLDAPEVLLRIDRVRPNKREGQYELHIAKVLKCLRWDRRRRRPK
jgi:hypothetical protein